MGDFVPSSESLQDKMSGQEYGVYNQSFETKVHGPPPPPSPSRNSHGYQTEHYESVGKFGPATKDNYSESEWGMVLTSNNENVDIETYKNEPPRTRNHGE